MSLLTEMEMTWEKIRSSGREVIDLTNIFLVPISIGGVSPWM